MTCKIDHLVILRKHRKQPSASRKLLIIQIHKRIVKYEERFLSRIPVSYTHLDINVYDTGLQAGSMMIRKLQNPELLIQSYTTLPVIIQGESTRPPVSYTHL